MKIKRVGALSLGKVLGALYGLVGLIFGGLFACMSILGAGMTAQIADESSSAWVGALFGVGAVIFAPIFYGVIGFLVGVIFGALYNLVAKWVGGIELELEEG